MILSILVLGFALGYAAKMVKEWVAPGKPDFDSTKQLLDEG